MLKIYQLESIPIHNHVQKQINGNLKARGKAVELQNSAFAYLSNSAYIPEVRSQTVEMTLYHNGIISATQQGVLLQGLIGKIVDAIAYVNAIGEKQSCCGGKITCPCDSCCTDCCCLIWYHSFVRIDEVQIEEKNVSDIATVKLTYTMQMPYWEVLNRGIWYYDNVQYADFSSARERDVPYLASDMITLLPKCGDFYKPCGGFQRIQWDDYDFLLDPIYMNELFCADYNGNGCENIKTGGGIGLYTISGRRDKFDIHVNKFIFNAPSKVTYIFKNYGQDGQIRITNRYGINMRKETATITIDLDEIQDIMAQNGVTHVGSDKIIINESIDGYAQIRDSDGNIKLYIGSAVNKNKQWMGEFYPGMNRVEIEQMTYANTFKYGIIYQHRSF